MPERKRSPYCTTNDPDRKKHGFPSEEGENIYKNYKLKNTFYYFTRNIPEMLICPSKGNHYSRKTRTRKQSRWQWYHTQMNCNGSNCHLSPIVKTKHKLLEICLACLILKLNFITIAWSYWLLRILNQPVPEENKNTIKENLQNKFV